MDLQSTFHQRPSVLFLGPRRSGKSSILRTLYSRISPHNTLFLAPTAIEQDHYRLYNVIANGLFTYNVYDTPGDYSWSRLLRTETKISSSSSVVVSSSNGTVTASSSSATTGTMFSTANVSIYSAATILTQTQIPVVHFNDIAEDPFLNVPFPSPFLLPTTTNTISSNNNNNDDDGNSVRKYPSLPTDETKLASLYPTGNAELFNAMVQYSNLEATLSAERLSIPISTLFKNCKTIILVIDCMDENSYANIHTLLYELSIVLKLYHDLVQYYYQITSSSASNRTSQLPTSASVTLPSIEIFLHKMDNENKLVHTLPNRNDNNPLQNNGNSGGSSSSSSSFTTETRTEILREWGTFITNELVDLGFRITGTGSNYVTNPKASKLSSSASSSSSSSSSSSVVSHGNLSIPTNGPSSSSSSSTSSSSSSPIPLAVSFYLTSIYDHSIFEAMSRVIQKVTPGPVLYPYLETLSNTLVHTCRLEKIFLMDTVTRLYHVTDSTPLQEGIYELVAEALDVAADVALIYDPYTSLPTAGDNPDAFLVSRAQQIANTRTETAGRCSGCTVRLSDGTIMYAVEIVPYIMILCIIKDNLPTGGNNGNTGGTITTSLATTSSLTSSSSSSLFLSSSNVPLPRTLLSLNHRSFIDYNIQVFVEALNKLFATTKGEKEIK